MKEIRWEIPSLTKTVKEIIPNSTIEMKLNNQIILCEDAKQFIDYLSDSIVVKNSKAIMKRNMYLQTLSVVYKLGAIYIVVKFFPEILSLFINLRG